MYESIVKKTTIKHEIKKREVLAQYTHEHIEIKGQLTKVSLKILKTPTERLDRTLRESKL